MVEEQGRQDRDPLDATIGVLERALDSEAGRLETRRGELAAAGEALLRLRAQVHASGFTPRFDVGVEPVAPSMVAPIVEQLGRRCRGVLRTCVVSVEVGPGLDEHAIRTAQDRIGSGLPQRALYLDTLLDSAEGRRWVRSWGEVGEEQRVTTVPLSDFAVFGSEGVLAVSTWGDPASSYLLLRHPVLVAAFSALFDTAWRSALPMPTSRRPGEREDDRLIALLAAGVKDEAIARHLGCGLRTVRRRVSRLMDEYGVDTRFQLGVAVAGDDRL